MAKIKNNWKEEIKKLPQEAQDEFKLMYIDTKAKAEVDIIPDPQVYGTYAMQIKRKDYTTHLLWTQDGFEEVEFESWPPESGDLQFF